MALLPPKPENLDEITSDFEPIPQGEYQALISNSEMKDTAAGTGQYLKLEWTIQDQEYAGRKVFQNLNLVNPNKQAQNIAWAQFKEICAAMDLDYNDVEDASELHGNVVTVKLDIRPGQGKYGPQNTVQKITA